MGIKKRRQWLVPQLREAAAGGERAHGGRTRGRARVMASTEDAAELDSRCLSSFPQQQFIGHLGQGSLGAVVKKTEYFSFPKCSEWTGMVGF